MLVEYAEFLAKTHPRPVVTEPVDIPRPSQETVVAAIRRLSETFPMLDRSALLSDASALMTQRLMQGRAAVEVIDELEVVFRRHYGAFQARRSPDDDDAAPGEAPAR